MLQRLFGGILIPPAVHRELLIKPGVETERLVLALDDFIRLAERPALDSITDAATSELDSGEREAIALARLQGDVLILDDKLGRAAARRLGLSVTGTAGVLVQARQAGLIKSVRVTLETIRANGYWLSDELIEAAALRCGEA